MRTYTYNRHVHDVMYALRPLFAVGQLLGVFRFRYKNNQLIPVDGKMKFAVMCIICFYCSIWLTILYMDMPNDGPLSTLSVYLTTILTAAYYIVTLIIQSITESSTNIQIIYFFEKLGLMLDSNVTSNFYKRLRRFTLCSGFLVFLLCLSFSIWYHFLFDPLLLLDFIINSVTYLQDIETILVCTFVFFLKIRLTAINQNLENLLRNSRVPHMYYSCINGILHKREQAKITRNTVESNYIVKLRNQSMAYVLIGKTCNLINNLYNFHILAVLLATFLILVFTLVATLQVFRCELS